MKRNSKESFSSESSLMNLTWYAPQLKTVLTRTKAPQFRVPKTATKTPQIGTSGYTKHNGEAYIRIISTKRWFCFLSRGGGIRFLWFMTVWQSHDYRLPLHPSAHSIATQPKILAFAIEQTKPIDDGYWFIGFGGEDGAGWNGAAAVPPSALCSEPVWKHRWLHNTGMILDWDDNGEQKLPSRIS